MDTSHADSIAGLHLLSCAPVPHSMLSFLPALQHCASKQKRTPFKRMSGQVQGCMPIIPAFERFRRLRQKDLMPKTLMGYTLRFIIHRDQKPILKFIGNMKEHSQHNTKQKEHSQRHHIT